LHGYLVGVTGSAFGVTGSAFGVTGSAFGVTGSAFGVTGSAFGVQNFRPVPLTGYLQTGLAGLVALLWSGPALTQPVCSMLSLDAPDNGILTFSACLAEQPPFT
jgi:hypothetical protein